MTRTKRARASISPTRPNKSQFDLASGANLPVFVAQNELKPLIEDEYWAGAGAPVRYLDDGREAVGFEASVLPATCRLNNLHERHQLLLDLRRRRVVVGHRPFRVFPPENLA